MKATDGKPDLIPVFPEPKIGLLIYENTYYMVVVGIPAPTREFPQPVAAYLLINKETGVTEFFHSLKHHTIEWADNLSKALMELEDEKLEEKGTETIVVN